MVGEEMRDRLSEIKEEIEKDSGKYDLTEILGSRNPYGGLPGLQKRELEETWPDRFSDWLNNGESKPNYFENA